jgi:hypothetical protein
LAALIGIAIEEVENLRIMGRPLGDAIAGIET